MELEQTRHTWRGVSFWGCLWRGEPGEKASGVALGKRAIAQVWVGGGQKISPRAGMSEPVGANESEFSISHAPLSAIYQLMSS